MSAALHAPTSIWDPRMPLPAPGWVSAAALGAGLFHAALVLHQGWLALLAPLAWVPLVRVRDARCALYGGVALGLAVVAPHLGFFWGIFGWPSVLLWLAVAFWMGLFLLLGSQCWQRGRIGWLIGVLPMLWTGLEYFRSELYYLRFSWLTLGFVAADGGPAHSLLRWTGSFGLGFLAFLAAAIAWFAPGRQRWWCLAWPGILLGLALPPTGLEATPSPGGRLLDVAGAQVEGVPESELPGILDRARGQYPDARLFLLPEYALDGSPDEALRGWCRQHGVHLVVGGREPLEAGRFRNTAFVVDPRGEIAFRQTKSVPIQFFQDGEPANFQSVWPSPWGPVGIAICYDLSYTRVMDRLVRQGAVGLVIPTMDAWSWGKAQHALHARVAPIRASEYRLPILRCASSGISQLVDESGRVRASAPDDPRTRIFGGRLTLGSPGMLPWDRWLAPACVAGTGLVTLGLVGLHLRAVTTSRAS